MKCKFSKSVLPAALLATFGVLLAGRATAQTFTTLHDFTDGSDGAYPYAALILSGNTLYGTAYLGGSADYGSVFSLNANGTGFTTLYSFTNGSNGFEPESSLVLSGNTLYGTTYEGGSAGAGTVFALGTNGTGYTTLHSFGVTTGDGTAPYAGLILSGGTLYGTAYAGGSADHGTVFSLNTNGTGYTTLYSFTNGSDGASPNAGLLLSGNTLYGAATYGGSTGDGTLFALNTNGTGFTILHTFTDGNDGGNPTAALILSGNTLYGTALRGGSAGDGTVFALATNGTGFTNLHSFTNGSDGDGPLAGLVLSGNTLYGTAYEGGSSSEGTVFALTTNGTGFTTLHSFSTLSAGKNSDGIYPYAGLILTGNTLYGMANDGGTSGDGTIFSLTLGTVSLAASTTTVASSLNPSPYGEAGVTFTATVTGFGGTPTGTVQFQINGENFGGTVFLVGGSALSGALPVTLAPGNYTVTAIYSGDQNFTASSGTLSGGQTVSLNSSCNCGSNGVVGAETFTVLYSFTNGIDGASPNSRLIISGNTLYGTAYLNGSTNYGIVFAENTNGTGFTILHGFTNGTDGADPYAGMVLSGNTLYGTTSEGGSANYGVVFSLNTNGTGFTTLHTFTALSYNLKTGAYSNSDGAVPFGGLLLSGNVLYGTASGGGSSDFGTVFALNTNGTGFTNLHSFTIGTDGAYPNAGLVLSGNTLYGTAQSGGASGNGTVFALNTNGTGFANLHSFAAGTGTSQNVTNSDGAYIIAGLVLSGSTLYGTAADGGASGNGTVFALNTNGTGFTILHSFNGAGDGANPDSGLIVSGNTLFGTAIVGGNGCGTVFALNTNGTGYTALYSFTCGFDGDVPYGGVTFSGNTLYGTAEGGGRSWGTVFALTVTNSGSTSNCLQVQSPGNISVNACTNTQVFYAPTVTDLACSNWMVVCAPPSGSSFAPGTITTVNCSVSDCCGYSNNSSFTVTVVCPGTGSPSNIVQNGSFCAGNTGFTSAYTYVPYDYANYTLTPQVVAGDYTVGPYVPPSYYDWAQFYTIAGGCQMLIANGAASAAESVWAQTVAVSTNRSYTISFYLAEISTPGVVADIAVNLGGTQLGTATAPSTIDTWQQFSFTWNSGTNTSVLLALNDLQTSVNENDFALANISMSSVMAASTTAVSSSLNPSPYGEAGVTFTATVTGPGGTPTGTVQFQINGENFGGTVFLVGGSAPSGALPVTLAPGNYAVTALYSGDQNFATSTGTLSGGQTVSLNSSCNCGSNGVVSAGTFTTLYNFTNGSDGTAPHGQLIISGSTLYGTAFYGGISGDGTVFALNTNGGGFTTLYNFTNGIDGATPNAGVILSGNTLYGTTSSGGNPAGTYGAAGTVFALNINGAGFTSLHSFTNGSDGPIADAGVMLSGNTLYGTTIRGGSGEAGTVFSINTNGTGDTNLYGFTDVGSDGGEPFAGLIVAGNKLYGTVYFGGLNGYGSGTVFSINTNGTGFTNLYSFTALSAGNQPYTNSDGANPNAGLVLSGNTLFGTTVAGGNSGYGTVFSINTNGTGFTNLYSFTALSGSFNTNGDGANPYAALILSGNTLYGTALEGGSSGYGTVFSLNTNGTGFTVMHSFRGSDGEGPYAGLLLAGNTLYGTTASAGTLAYGTVFALTLTNSAAISVTNCLQVQSPGNISVNACSNVAVYYTPTVTDLACSNWTVVCTPPSGSSFAPGTVSTVNCSVSDCCGYSNNSSFTVAVVCPGAGFPSNIVQNGSFCAGNSSFTSAYTYVPYDYANYTLTPTVVAGDYTVGPYVPPSYFDWAQFYTEGGGCQMLIANGAQNAAESVWAQAVPVLTNTTYAISFYLAEISTPTNLANIAVIVGGNQIGTATAPSTIDTWEQFSFAWNSGTNTSVLLALNDLQTAVNENDFALANISMSVSGPQLAISRAGINVILTWTNTATGFILESTTNLAPPAVWNTVSSAPVIVNGQFTVTNSITNTDRFYRLDQ